MWKRLNQVIAFFEDRRIPKAKEYRQPPEAGKGRKTDFSLESPERNDNILILAQCDPFYTSDFQNYKIINLCYLSHYICGNLL